MQCADVCAVDRKLEEGQICVRRRTRVTGVGLEGAG